MILEDLLYSSPAIFDIEREIKVLQLFSTRFAVRATSSWDRALPVIPQARFVMQEIPQTRRPIWWAAIASQAVLIPIASAPRLRHIRTSAGVSYCGPVS